MPDPLMTESAQLVAERLRSAPVPPVDVEDVVTNATRSGRSGTARRRAVGSVAALAVVGLVAGIAAATWPERAPEELLVADAPPPASARDLTAPGTTISLPPEPVGTPGVPRSGAEYAAIAAAVTDREVVDSPRNAKEPNVPHGEYYLDGFKTKTIASWGPQNAGSPDAMFDGPVEAPTGSTLVRCETQQALEAVSTPAGADAQFGGCEVREDGSTVHLETVTGTGTSWSLAKVYLPDGWTLQTVSFDEDPDGRTLDRPLPRPEELLALTDEGQWWK